MEASPALAAYPESIPPGKHVLRVAHASDQTNERIIEIRLMPTSKSSRRSLSQRHRAVCLLHKAVAWEAYPAWPQCSPWWSPAQSADRASPRAQNFVVVAVIRISIW